MTALIAESSPLLPKIPSDPGIDTTRTFGFSPSSMPYSRYVAEGRVPQRQSPSPRAFAGQTPSQYPRGTGYAITESFPCDDPGAPAPARIPRSTRPNCSTCRSYQGCTCSSDTNDLQAGGSREGGGGGGSSRGSGWCKDRARVGLSLGEESPSAGTKKQSAVTSTAATGTRAARDVGVAKPFRKKSDWENLLGAVDLELRAQELGASNSAATTASPSKRSKTELGYAGRSSYGNINNGAGTCRVPLHPSGGGNCHSPSSAHIAGAIIESDMEPKLKHHRRGGAEAAGGGPAYSGSTADAACLLATLPQRMLAGVSAQPSCSPDVDTPISVTSSPSLAPVQAPAGPARVQASGRRGPRGQSRFKGVCITRAGKWRAVIYIGRKQKYLGVFDSEYDAARAYDHAAVQHFAEGAKLNFPGGLKEQLEAAARAPTVPPATHGGGGSGGAAAARAATPPPFEEEPVDDVVSGSSNRGQKRSYNDRYDDEEWVCDDGSWKNSRR